MPSTASPAPSQARSDVIHALGEILDPADLLEGDAVTARNAHVWDPAPLNAMVVARPRSVDGVSAVLKACHERHQCVVTHGGLTGLVRATHSDASDVVLSLERLNAIEAIDPVAGTVTVQAGAVLEKVQDALAEHGLQLGLDLGARGSCTIGGNISTNAGGLNVLRHGMMREQVLGLEVVLADGTVMSSMNQMIKNNTGIDLKHLFIGSEGTLGVVTRAVLKVSAATPHARTALIACESFDQVTGLLSHLSSRCTGMLAAFEVMWNRFYRLNTDTHHEGYADAPLDRDFPIYVITEISGGDQQQVETSFDAAMETAMENGLIVDAVLPQSEAERQQVWRLRENVDTQRRHTPHFTYDVSLPIPHMPAYVSEVEAALEARWPGVNVYVYGHLADGNLHIVVAPLAMNEGPEPGTDIDAWKLDCDAIIYAPLNAIGGSISAEHGIGRTKKAWLHVSRSDTERMLMTQLKQTLDPRGILNPGLIL